MKEDLLGNLKEAIKASEQSTIFNSDKTEERILECCVRYLRYHGYTVVDPKVFNKKIASIDELIAYFYMLLNSNHPEDFTTSYNDNKDRSIAKKFVENRTLATGASREHALNECGEIIKTLFEHEKEFNFKYSLNFSIFGQDNSKWITDKTIQIMNENLKSKREEYAVKLRNKAVEADTSPRGYDDLDELLRKMEEDEKNG